jgi:hypothetical protein
LNSGALQLDFRAKAGARGAAITIHVLLLGSPMQKKCHTFFFQAANKRGCCLQTVNSPRCLVDGIFDLSFTLPPELTIGNSGMSGCLSGFRACRIT